MINITYTATGATHDVYPGGYLIPDASGADVDLVLGSGRIVHMFAEAGVVRVYDAYVPATFLPFKEADEGMRHSLKAAAILTAELGRNHPFGANALATPRFDAVNLKGQYAGTAELDEGIYCPFGIVVAWTGQAATDVLTVQYEPSSMGAVRYAKYLRDLVWTNDATYAISSIAAGDPTELTLATPMPQPRNKVVAVDVQGVTGGAPNLADGRYAGTVVDATTLNVAALTGGAPTGGTATILANALSGALRP